MGEKGKLVERVQNSPTHCLEGSGGKKENKKSSYLYCTGKKGSLGKGCAILWG